MREASKPHKGTEEEPEPVKEASKPHEETEEEAQVERHRKRQQIHENKEKYNAKKVNSSKKKTKKFKMNVQSSVGNQQSHSKSKDPEGPL